jgi:hypothetical protein
MSDHPSISFIKAGYQGLYSLIDEYSSPNRFLFLSLFHLCTLIDVVLTLNPNCQPSVPTGIDLALF